MSPEHLQSKSNYFVRFFKGPHLWTYLYKCPPLFSGFHSFNDIHRQCSYCLKYNFYTELFFTHKQHFNHYKFIQISKKKKKKRKKEKRNITKKHNITKKELKTKHVILQLK